jgi:hypothetical protein
LPVGETSGGVVLVAVCALEVASGQGILGWRKYCR